MEKIINYFFDEEEIHEKKMFQFWVLKATPISLLIATLIHLSQQLN